MQLGLWRWPELHGPSPTGGGAAAPQCQARSCLPETRGWGWASRANEQAGTAPGAGRAWALRRAAAPGLQSRRAACRAEPGGLTKGGRLWTPRPCASRKPEAQTIILQEGKAVHFALGEATLAQHHAGATTSPSRQRRRGRLRGAGGHCQQKGLVSVWCCACCGPGSLAQHRCCVHKQAMFRGATSIIQPFRVYMLRVLWGPPMPATCNPCNRCNTCNLCNPCNTCNLGNPCNL
jgi:hypothetical protein